MLIVEYKCSRCKTVNRIKYDDFNKETIRWIDDIAECTNKGSYQHDYCSWFIPFVCRICGNKLMKYYPTVGGWNYDKGLEYIRYDYSKCNPKYSSWFGYLNG